MGWLSDTFDKILDPAGIVPDKAMKYVRMTHDPGNLIYDNFDNADEEDSAAAAGGNSLGTGANPRLGSSRNKAMQDAFARGRLGIGNSRAESRHVNPTGSNPPGSSRSFNKSTATPVVSTATPVSPTLPAGRYQYLDLILSSDKPIGPDNPLYNILSSGYARRL